MYWNIYSQLWPFFTSISPGPKLRKRWARPLRPSITSWHVGINLLFLVFVYVSTGKVLFIFFFFNSHGFLVSVWYFSKEITKTEPAYEGFRVSHGDEWWPCGMWRRLDFRLYRLFRGIRIFHLHGCGPGSVVGTVTGYGLDGPGIESR